MLTIELTEKDLLAVQLMIDAEVRDNENKIIKIREDECNDCYCFIEMLRQRNELLKRVAQKLKNAKECAKEEDEDVGDK